MSFLIELHNCRDTINTQLAQSLPEYFLKYYGQQSPWTQELTHFVVHGGKRIRPALAMMYAQELGADLEEFGNLFCALEVFHDFLLVHDDIVDQDELRWGEATVYKALQTAYPDLQIKDHVHFGQSLATIGGDVLHAIAQQYIFDANLDNTHKILLLQTMNDAMLEVGQGRYKQFLSDSMRLDQVTLDYILMHNIGQVTSSYTLLFPLKFSAALVTGKSEINPLMKQLCSCVGILFQTGDDIIGLFGDPKKSGKSNIGDLIQGKKTLPVYFAYQAAPENQKAILTALIGKEGLTEAEAEQAKSIIRQYGLEPSKVFMQQAADEAFSSIEQLNYSNDYKARRHDFVSYLLERDA